MLSALAAQRPEPAGPAAIASALVFGGEMPAAAQTRELPADVKASLAEFRKREKRFKPTVQLPGRLDGDDIEDSVYRKHVDLERTVFSTFENSLNTAQQFATEVELRYEWEGMADGPLAEASSADAYLSRHANSPIEPYVLLFSGHRKLCAVSDYTGADPTAPESRSIMGQAVRQLQSARGAGNPLIRVAADHLLRTRRCF